MNTTKRLGRPKSLDPMNRWLQVRLTVAEYAAVKKRAGDEGISAWVRKILDRAARTG